MRRIITLILSVALLFSTVAAKGDKKSVEVTGLGQTEQDAINDAKRNAVSQGLGSFINTETVLENFMLKYDKIVSTSKGFVTDLEVLSKKKTVDGLVEVKVKAVVSGDNIFGNKVAMKLLLESLGKPRLMVLMNEVDYQNQVVPNPISEAEITSMLIEQGFDLVDGNQIDAIRAGDEAKALVGGDKKAAQIISKRFGAEVLIVGSTKMRSLKNKMLGDMLSNQVVITLKGINSSTGAVIYSTSVSGAYPHIDPMVGGQKAIKKSINKGFVDKFVVKMLDAFQDKQNNGISLKVMTYGIDSFGKYKKVKAFLESVKVFKNVTKRNWNKESGLCEFSVKSMQSNTELVAENLDGKKVGDQAVSVNDFTASSIDIKLK